MKRPIYLDYNATTPTDPGVVEAMLPYFSNAFGNAASIDHHYGREARQAVERAREQVAALIGATPEEIIFTSGATEADNIAVLGTLARAGDDAEIIVSAIEHPAVLEPARTLGSRVRILPVAKDGRVDPGELRELLTPRTALVSVMAANNETGAIQPLREIAEVCAEADVPLHTDATQAVGRLALDVDQLQLALLSLSGHKVYGPKGIGALYVRRRGRRAKVAPLLYGGGHERNLRPGTANVPAIVGLGAAVDLALEQWTDEAPAQSELRDELMSILEPLGGISPNAPLAQTLPQTLSLRIGGVGARALMHTTRDDLAFSSGSACATTKAEPSHVLLAQGLSPQAAAESIRLSLGRFTTRDEILEAGRVLVDAVTELRRLTERAA